LMRAAAHSWRCNTSDEISARSGIVQGQRGRPISV
jgi:hypothetical protein